MVKFGKYLAESSVPEWRDKYLDYKALKKVLKRLSAAAIGARRAPVSPPAVGEDGRPLPPAMRRVVTDHLTGRPFMVAVTTPLVEPIIDLSGRAAPSSASTPDPFPLSLTTLMPTTMAHREIEMQFFALLQSELEKIVDFFHEQSAFFAGQVDAMMVRTERRASVGSSFRLLLQRLYQGLQFLQNYHVLNYVAVAKILKKHDKISSWHSSTQVIVPHLQRPDVYPSLAPVLDMSRQVQDVFLQLYPGGTDMLRVIPQPESHTTSFTAGVTVGLLIALIGVIGAMFALNPTPSLPPGFMAAFPPFRFLILVTFALVIWGVDLAVFTSKRINYGSRTASPVFLTGPLTWLACLFRVHTAGVAVVGAAEQSGDPGGGLVLRHCPVVAVGVPGRDHVHHDLGHQPGMVAPGRHGHPGGRPVLPVRRVLQIVARLLSPHALDDRLLAVLPGPLPDVLHRRYPCTYDERDGALTVSLTGVVRCRRRPWCASCTT